MTTVAGDAVAVAVLVVVAVSPWFRGSPLSPHRRSSTPERRYVERPVIGADAAVLVELADAALRSGGSIPGTLIALGEAVGGADGAALARAGSVLVLGGSWDEAWLSPEERHVPQARRAPSDALATLADALEPAWVDGVPAGALLRRAAERVRAGRSRHAREAAARLGVRLVLPLGLCYLPAFVLLGLVPVALATGFGLGFGG